MRERDATDRLAAVNPGAIIGPLLSDDPSYSLQAIDRMLGGMPGVPKLGFSFVDVRDVADLHRLAMTAPEAGGERFIAVERFLWMAEVGAVLRERLGERARKVPTRTVPNFLVRGMSLFDRQRALGRLGPGAEGDLLEREGEDAARLGAASGRGLDRRLRREHAQVASIGNSAVSRCVWAEAPISVKSRCASRSSRSRSLLVAAEARQVGAARLVRRSARRPSDSSSRATSSARAAPPRSPSRAPAPGESQQDPRQRQLCVDLEWR